MLDELNAALRPHNLRFAPDISTASRATVGGMMANNSSGARSVMYGKTIDHVHRAAGRAVGRIGRPLPPLAARRRSTRSAAATRSRRPVTGEVRRLARDARRRNRSPISQGAAPRWRLQPRLASSLPDRPFNLDEADRRLGRHARHGARSRQSRWCRCRRRRRCWPFSSPTAGSTRGDALILAHHPSAIEVMDRLHPRQHETERRARSHAPNVHRRRPGRCSVWRSMPTRRPMPPASTHSNAT